MWALPGTLLVVSACLPIAEDAEWDAPAGIDCEWARVRSVTDGDTVRVDIADGEQNVAVRYIGIDTPEQAGSPGGPEPFAREASERNEALVAGDRVCLERDVSETDRFDRLLRYVWMEDGRMANEVLVEEGLAEAVEFRPDVRRSAQLEAAEERARRARAGIWRD